MTPSSVWALGAATAVLQQLQAALAPAAAPCLGLGEQISTLTARFLSAPITPASALDCESDRRRLLDGCGRLVLQAAFNHSEPEDPQAAPKHTQRDRQD